MTYYWQAEDGRGEVCGHKHRYFTRAVRCARHLERLARWASRREEWRVERVERVEPSQ